MEAVLKEHKLNPSDVLGVSTRIKDLQTAFRAAKTAEEQDKVIRDAGIVDSLPVSKEYATTPASFLAINSLNISVACQNMCDFIATYALDINSLGLDAPADESAWMQTVSVGNRHLAAHKMDECGDLGPKLVEGRSFVQSIKPEESKTTESVVLGRPRMHGYESEKSAPNGQAPRDRIHAHLDGNNVKGEIFNEVRIRNEAISLSTLGSVGMSARHIGRTELKDVDSFARGPFTMFTMTRPAREQVKHAVVADHDSRAGGISVVAKIYHGDYDWIFAVARRCLVSDFLEVVLHCCELVAKSLLEADDKVALKPLIFVSAPGNLKNLKSDDQRLTSVYAGLVNRDRRVGIHAIDEDGVHFNAVMGGLAARDRRVGIHAIDEDGVHFNAVKGGLAARDAEKGIFGLDEETRRLNSIKGGLAARDANAGIHGLDEETRRLNATQGGLASLAANVGIHEVDEHGIKFNAVKGGLVGGVASRDANAGIHGLDEETRRLNSVKGGCAVRDAQKGIHEVDEHGVKFHAVRGGKIGGQVTKAKSVGIFGRTAEQHSADSKLAGARGSAVTHQRFTAENQHRIRQFSILGKNADDDSIEEYVLEAITEKKAHNGEEAWRLRLQQTTFQALRRAIQTHVGDQGDRKLLESSVQPGGRSGKSSFCKIKVPDDNATSWNAEDYRNTKTFAKKYRFFFDLLRYVVIVESEDDAYVATDADEHPLE